MVEAEAIALLYNVSTASSGNENILLSTLTFVASRRGAFFAFLSERRQVPGRRKMRFTREGGASTLART